MSAWQQSVSSVSQLSCNVAVQLRDVSSVQLLSEGSVATRQVGCQLSCNLSAEIKFVISPATGWLSRSLSPLLCSVFLVAVCQLSCNMPSLHRSAESQEHNPDAGPDPGQSWTRFKPSTIASLNGNLQRRLYHDLTQVREDNEDVTNDPNRQPQQDMVEFLKVAADAIMSFYATQAGACLFTT